MTIVTGSGVVDGLNEGYVLTVQHGVNDLLRTEIPIALAMRMRLAYRKEIGVQVSAKLQDRSRRAREGAIRGKHLVS